VAELYDSYHRLWDCGYGGPWLWRAVTTETTKKAAVAAVLD